MEGPGPGPTEASEHLGLRNVFLTFSLRFFYVFANMKNSLAWIGPGATPGAAGVEAGEAAGEGSRRGGRRT